MLYQTCTICLLQTLRKHTKNHMGGQESLSLEFVDNLNLTLFVKHRFAVYVIYRLTNFILQRQTDRGFEPRSGQTKDY